jgi:hypothetical protein
MQLISFASLPNVKHYLTDLRQLPQVQHLCDKYESLKMGANTITIRTDRFSDRTWMLVAVRPLRSLSAKLWPPKL